MRKTLSLYIHVPFCKRKCPYCAFYSRTYSEDEADRYLDGLEREINWWKSSGLETGLLKTLYIGGGTPSILEKHHWIRLADLLDRYFFFAPDAEVTVEANPDSIREDLLSLWNSWRISRISLGVQSLDEKDLLWLKRPYNKSSVCHALDQIRNYPFALSCDLMFSMAGQTIGKWHSTLSELLSNWRPEHISTYQLTLEKDTPWGEHPPEGIEDGYGTYRFAQWYLPHKGYEQYEIASFARDNNYCRHNLAYWFRDNVLGLGPSAWGFLDGFRYGNYRDLDIYLNTLKNTPGKGALSFTEELDEEGSAREAVILALRTVWGFSEPELRGKFGTETMEKVLKELEDVPEELLNREKGRISLSPRGMRVGNQVWERLI